MRSHGQVRARRPTDGGPVDPVGRLEKNGPAPDALLTSPSGEPVNITNLMLNQHRRDSLPASPALVRLEVAQSLGLLDDWLGRCLYVLNDSARHPFDLRDAVSGKTELPQLAS